MKKRIALVSGNVTDGITFIRGHMALRYLRDEYEFYCYSYNDLDHAKLLYMDAMIVFHPYHKAQAHLIHRAKFHYNIPVIVDMDDLLDNLPTDHPSFFGFGDNSVKEILSLATHVTVSTEYLKRYWGLPKATVIENVIDPTRYSSLDTSHKNHHSGFVVGWTGSQTHTPDLFNTGFISGLTEAMREEPEIKAYFHMLCPQPLIDEFGTRITFNEVAVDYMDYPSMCYTYPFDICCVPLCNHPFNHGKSDLRLLDMAPFNIPVLASPVHEFKRHDFLGLVHDGCWKEAILHAFKNRQRLDDMARVAREYVFNNRTVDKAVSKWKQVIGSLLV